MLCRRPSLPAMTLCIGCADNEPVKPCSARVSKRRSRDTRMPDNSQELIRLAFEAAKRSGRPNWYRMDVGVLKNRILNVTNGGFRESDYGCTAFMEFVRSHSDILELDETRWPPPVTLKGVHEEPELASDPVRKQVRPDLWRAVMDFSGDRRYVWDDDEGVAKLADDVAVGGPTMPTITVVEFTKWKRAFADSVDDAAKDDLFNDWVEKLRPTKLLAPRVRYRWNDYLKEEVEKHLRGWFEEQNLPLPPDLVKPQEGGVRSPDDELRRRLIACVRAMTTEELKTVQIPSSVLLRLKL